MCNRYTTPQENEVERFWRVDRTNQPSLWPRDINPRRPGPFIRGAARELVVGQWGLIPDSSKVSIPRDKNGKLLSTNNARAEEVHWKFSYRDPWAKGQRCIIPAESFIEPNWETLKNIWWEFRRADGDPWGLAGIWNTWIDKDTGEVHESYSMLTLNANAHPLMRRMHKPEIDPKTKLPLAPEKQDKRSVVPIELADVDTWLTGTIEEAKALIRLAPVEAFNAFPLTPRSPQPELI